MKTPLFDEKEILKRCKSDDFGAFKQLYQYYAPVLSTKILKLVRSTDLTEDLIQEIFMKIWEIRAEIDLDKSFPAFLFKIATNKSIDAYRSSVYQQNILLHSRYMETHNQLEEDIAFRETENILQRALDRLTPRQREVFILHKLEGKNYREISKLLNISSSAINQHLQLANKHLKSFLKSHMDAILLIALMDIMK